MRGEGEVGRVRVRGEVGRVRGEVGRVRVRGNG